MDDQEFTPEYLERLHAFWEEMERLNPPPPREFTLSKEAIDKLLNRTIVTETHAQDMREVDEFFFQHYTIKTIGSLMREKLEQMKFVPSDLVCKDVVVIPVDFLKWLKKKVYLTGEAESSINWLIRVAEGKCENE